ncbi:hypothetical protein CF98_17160 [Halopseudomonas bauzanensis]|nr:hypothetical protein CF98_17160 [Halopseudomonas bauzanensis]
MGLLEVERGRHLLLHGFTGNIWNAEQIKCARLTDANQFSEKMDRVVHMLKYLGANYLVDVVIR